ncbi:1-phosphatidylinositol-3-phosphate 5-kinase FAB1 [Gossypium arboreum]|uniref:1-phosphatidylinositol-3-phosphate 5-kinase n=1 Tax=Gossypium arboreum TaxID=29729 RepID=A0A0B0PR86_GOSAR|nr:1-phosphatidylinositol-3-phosphate 5-kinase FAB1 [Gossypium arboreum]
MDATSKTISELVSLVKSWLPWRSEPDNVSRDFWMPDHICRVCYECDSQFTLFNRRHHCRLCGRVFCAKCTTNSVPAPLDDFSILQEEREQLRVCNYCFKQWEQGINAINDEVQELDEDISSSPSAASFMSTKSNYSSSYSLGSVPYLAHSRSIPSPRQLSSMNRSMDRSSKRITMTSDDLMMDVEDPSSNYELLSDRSDYDDDDDDDEYSIYLSDSESKHFSQDSGYCSPIGFDETSNDELHAFHPDSENNDSKNLSCSPIDHSLPSPCLEGISQIVKEDEPEVGDEDRSREEHKKAVKSIVDGHFRALVAQLLQVECLPVGDENDRESWLDIITALSWEAATLLKPDTSQGGGMDPGGYVKVKCIASGCRRESMVVKGVVCKKNVAHRRMNSKIEKPRLLILGGALEYQRVSNQLSSFDTLLKQEKDHLKMAVAKIHAHKPNILLVEKSVSRYAQEYLLEEDISLVLNIKRSLLERIARCTGAQIVPSVDHLSSQKLGYCEKFHVERFFEDLGSAGQRGKKLAKTLMYFEGCRKPLGFTILLRGENGDKLKKVKHVIQYGIFAAYHLALETSFLADEGASLPDSSFSSPITVTLLDKPPTIARSISTFPGFTVPVNETSQEPPHGSDLQRANSIPTLNLPFSVVNRALPKEAAQTCLSNGSSLPSPQSTTEKVNLDSFSKKTDTGPKESSTMGSFVNKSESATMSNHHVGLLNSSQQNSTVHIDQENCSTAVEIQSGLSEASSVHHDSQNCNNQSQEPKPIKEEFPPTPSDNQSILVSLSSRCAWKGTVCERSHLFRIKYYGSFDKPLGRFLRDHLFDQSYQCHCCDMPSEAHVHCYTHRQGTLTISVKKLTDVFLPGERVGKIWMWHRCLRCPRTNGFPPATLRVVMSDAAWGLSFGKFLELSFSNHAAASRVASCGHSLHRDCLRFYGFGRMVACFRYASIDVHSVYLPPPKLEFDYEIQEWIQKEKDKVVDRAEHLFSEVLKSLNQIAEKKISKGAPNSTVKSPESRNQISELEGILQKEKLEFEESLQKALNREVRKGQPVIDILELNWPQDNFSNLISGDEEKTVTDDEKLKDVDILEHGKGPECCDLSPVDEKLDRGSDQRELNGNADKSDVIQRELEVSGDLSLGIEEYGSLSASQSMYDQSDCEKPTATVRRVLSEGHFPVIEDLSDTLEAAWTGEIQQTVVLCKKDSCDLSDSAAAGTATERLNLENHSEGKIVPKALFSFSPSLSTRGSENLEDSISWLTMPFLSFYRSLNKNFLGSASKLDTFSEYDPVYVSSFRELEMQDGARLLLPLGVNDTVIPVYNDEPTSMISYALASPEYHFQVSNNGDRHKDSGDITTSVSADSSTLRSFLSVDESTFDPHQSFSSIDDGSGSRSLIMDPLSRTKALHVQVSFGDDGSADKVKYTVTCYYAKGFEALRRMCCPSELDYIRSLSRCKKWGAQGGKSNVFFAKTLDDRFIIKQVATKHLKGGKETKIDVLAMENLLFRRTCTRLYDLKGSSRSRYNPDTSGSNKVLLDQNFIESMPTSPIFVGNKAKRLLERAVWNDTAFLASSDVMDYSLLVGIDEEKHELVLGIIDFMRQYTWDKHLETWVKASGILGGPRNAAPTVISPKQYKKRFRKAMSTYFLMIPDQWSFSTMPRKPGLDTGEENGQIRTSVK